MQAHALSMTLNHAMATNKDLSKPLKKRKAVNLDSVEQNYGKALVDLQEWIGASILARYGSGSSFYRPGKIISCPSSGSVKVSLDRELEPTVYSDVLSSPEILGNHSPAAVLVTEGLPVCVKERPDDNIFVVGKVKQVNVGPPLKCMVESESLPAAVWVNRANIRLMQPPWHDDLRECSANQMVSRLSL